MKWVAYLSNGKTVVEEKEKPGERTAWQKLLQRCRDDNLQITALRLKYKDIQIHAMPHKMCDGYLQAYEYEEVVWRGIKNLKQGIGSVVGDKVFITWINDIKGNNNFVYQEVRQLSEVKIHTTLQ